MGEGDCQVPVEIKTSCAIKVHPHERPHQARGITPDGVYWTLTWWDRKLANNDPGSPANTDVGLRAITP
jgi:hypothetical protein